MTIIDRYIAMTWLRLLLLCQGSFLSIYLVLDMMEKIPNFLRVKGALSDIALFFAWKLPEMIGQTAAFSVLMATLLTLGLFTRNSEIVAMRSCGISLGRISLPMLLLGGGVSVLLLINAELIVPDSYERMARIERVNIKKRDSSAVFKRNNIWFRSDNRIMQAHLFDPQTQSLRGIVIWTLSPSTNPISRMDAESAELRGDAWLLRKVEVKEFTPGGGIVARKFPTLPTDLNLKLDDLRVLDKNADNLGFFKLREYANNLRKGGYEDFKYRTMMHTKLSAPLSALIMVILGIPFALRSSRSGGVALGIGASVALGFAYFVVNAVLLSYGRSGVLQPLVSAWGANFLFILGGIWLTMTIRN